jgi:peptidoglycan/LPS O-acetylase OafA/YrhL
VPATRLPELDLLKAAAAVAVVLIHTVRGPFETGASSLELGILEATRFAVPAFLFASGTLAARAESGGSFALGARLSRLLLPYLVATGAAEVYLAARGMGPSTGSLLKDLLLCAAFGPFYYVFVALQLVLLAPLVSRLGGYALVAITLLLALAQAATEAGFGLLPLFWQIRSPLLWWAYWFVGWCYGRRRDEAALWIAQRRRAPAAAILGGLLFACALAARWTSYGPLPASRLASWLGIYLALVTLLALGAASRGLASSAPVRFVSGASYAVYLWHLFAVYPLRELVPAPPATFDPWAVALPWVAGVVLPVLLVYGARRLVGERAARRWLGA